jgi:hypothetical protein
LEKLMMFVSRVVEVDAIGFRAAVGAGEFDVGGVCVTVGAPVAFRFLEAMPGVSSFAPFPFVLERPLLPAALPATACARFVSPRLGVVEAAESTPGFFFVVAATENS